MLAITQVNDLEKVIENSETNKENTEDSQFEEII